MDTSNLDAPEEPDRPDSHRGHRPLPADALLDAPTDPGPVDLPAARAAVERKVPTAGAQVGGYTIVGEIARGGMGIVYRARQTGLERDVALKMILDPDLGSESGRRRFENEAKAAASLDHPGIVPVYETGTHAGFPYFSMALVEGESLAESLRDGPLPPERAAEIGRDVAAALAYAHQRKIIHRDIKPANVLLERGGTPRITDFGVSKSLQAGCDLTTTGELVGTPHYMPPEQARSGSAEVGPPADIYSIGALLYAMLTGRPPFQAATPLEVVAQVLRQDPVPPTALNSSVPAELEVITLKCLSKSPRDRYRSASELAEDLGRFLDGEPIRARPPSLLRRLQFFLRRHFVVASVSGTAALVLVALTAVATVALLNARRKLADVQERLDLTSQQLQAERGQLGQLARRFEGVPDPDALIIRWQVERLAAASDRLAAEHPDLALQLAIEAVAKANAEGLSIPPAAMRRLREAVADGGESSVADLPLLEQLELARAAIRKPMSDAERALFGMAAAGDAEAGSQSAADPVATGRPDSPPESP